MNLMWEITFLDRLTTETRNNCCSNWPLQLHADYQCAIGPKINLLSCSFCFAIFANNKLAFLLVTVQLL